MAARIQARAGSGSGFEADPFAALYAEQWWPMLRLAQGLVDDVPSAEDVVQEAFAALYRKISTLHEPGSAVSYLRVCVVNGSRSALRRRRTARNHVPDVQADAPSADQGALLADERLAVRQALAGLPDRQREVLTLRFLADLSDEQIAQAIGSSASNVRSAASRGLAALRAGIGEQS